jgi:hypothetical protein
MRNKQHNQARIKHRLRLLMNRVLGIQQPGITQNVGKTSKRPLRNFYLHQALDYKEKRENLMGKNLEDLSVDGKYNMKTNLHEMR